MARYVPPKYGPGQGGFNQQTERGHWANAAGGWVPSPKRPKRTPPRKPTLRKVPDPFAPLSDQQLQQRAQQLFQQSLDPVLAQIRSAIEARSQAGQAAIQGLTQALGGLYAQAAPQAAAAYGQAQAAQSGLNTALANRLGSFGQANAGEVGNKLAYAGPSGANIAANAGTAGQGATNANFAKGAAGTEQLLAQGAAAQAYAGGLPGIAALTGMQNSRSLQAQLNKELADQLGQATANSGSSVASLYQHLVDQELQKAVARNTSGLNREKLAAQIANQKAMQKYRNQSLVYRAAQLGISQQKVNETARHNGITEGQAAQRLIQAEQRRRDANRRQSNWQVNPDGSFKLRLNHKTGKMERIPIKKPKNKSGSASGL